MSDYTPPTLVIPPPGGNPGDGTINGKLTLEVSPTPYIEIGGESTAVDGANHSIWKGNNFVLDPANTGDIYLCYSRGKLHIFNSISFDSGIITQYNNIGTIGLGVAPLYGKDVRTGLTAADASATTLYTTTAAGQVYEVAARIFGTGGTITSGVYTIGWTEGGTARTATVSITAAGTMDSAIFLLQPDNGTAITGQLTTLSGTSPVVNVAAILKEDV